MAGDDPVIMLTAPIPATRRRCSARGCARRHRRLRGQRGLRAGAAGLAGRHRGRRRAAQPARRRDRARPPAGRLRRPADDHARPPHAAPGPATACRRCARAAAWPTPRSWNWLAWFSTAVSPSPARAGGCRCLRVNRSVRNRFPTVTAARRRRRSPVYEACRGVVTGRRAVLMSIHPQLGTQLGTDSHGCSYWHGRPSHPSHER